MAVAAPERRPRTTSGEGDVARTAARAAAAAIAVAAIAFGLRRVGGSTVDHSTGLRHDVLAWVDRHLRATSAVATLIDVLVLDHEPPTAPARGTLAKSGG